MNSEDNEQAALKLAWMVLTFGGILLAAALIWQWHTRTNQDDAEPAPSLQAQTADGPADAEPEGPLEWAAVPAPPSSTSATTGAVDILEQDPGVIDRQAAMLRRDAEAAEKSEVGPSSLVLTEERIQALEREKRIIQ